MSSPLLDLEPSLLWQHFDGIRLIPRPSKHEEKITEHMEQWAAEKGYAVTKDEADQAEFADIQKKLTERLDAFFNRYANPRYDLWRGGGSKTFLLTSPQKPLR